jgi:hypothetical protein
MMRMLRIIACLGAIALAGRAADVPRKAPDLAIHMNSGKDLQLNSYRGKVVCVAFILTTCSHCQNTTRILSRVQNDLGARGFQVVEAAIDGNGKLLVPGFIQQFSPPFPVGYIEQPAAEQYLQHSPMLILHVPGMAFIDRKGQIVAQFEGDDPFLGEGVQEKNIRTKIEQLLGPAKLP